MLRLASLSLLAAALAGCAFFEDHEDYHGVPQDPPDLRVQQSPNDTVRVGETVTFTAVFRDSLNSKWLYDLTLNIDGRLQVFGEERSIRWTPSVPGNYRSRLRVADGSIRSRATLSFYTVVLP